MIIAQEKRKTNIAEYLIYMWQVEDLLRACKLDPELINTNLVNRFEVEDVKKKEISEWYLNLAQMMKLEKVVEKGHLQVFVNLVNDLNEFHLKLIETNADNDYFDIFRQNINSISELRTKSNSSNICDIEVCLNALYGLILLNLKNVDVSLQTKSEISGIAHMIGHLSARYLQFENDDFEF